MKYEQMWNELKKWCKKMQIKGEKELPIYGHAMKTVNQEIWRLEKKKEKEEQILKEAGY